MKNTAKFLIFTITTIAMAGCTPGVVTFGGNAPIAVTSPQGHIQYVTPKVDKHRMVTVPVSTGETFITNKVQAVLAEDSVLKQYHITASVHHGLAKLVGKVPNAAIKKYAIEVARNTQGVLAADASQLVVTQSK